MKLFNFRSLVAVNTKRKLFIPIFKYAKRHLSTRVKQVIKKYIFPYFFSPNSHVSAQIMREWKMSLSSRLDSAADIFVFGITSWDYRFQRPQHLALGLSSHGHRIFYIESEFASESATISVLKVQENVYKIKLYSPKNYFIYNDQPTKVDVNLMFESLKIIFQESRATNIVAKVDHPFWTPLVNHLNVPIIYDCIDEHAGFKETGDVIGNLEKDLLNHADLVIGSSDKLFKKITLAKPMNTLMLKNAGEYLHFRTASKLQINEVPQDIKHLPGPILGYYGAVADWLDSNIVKQLFDFRRELVVHDFIKMLIRY